MSDLGTATGEYGGSYSTNSTAEQTATGTGPYKVNATFTPNSDDTARLTFHLSPTRPEGLGGFIPLGTDNPRN